MWILQNNHLYFTSAQEGPLIPPINSVHLPLNSHEFNTRLQSKIASVFPTIQCEHKQPQIYLTPPKIITKHATCLQVFAEQVSDSKVHFLLSY